MLNFYIFQILKNMGLKYVLYRMWHEIKKKTGLLKFDFPTSYTIQNFVPLKDWRENAMPFFFFSREDLHDFTMEKEQKEKLKESFENIFNGQILFFNGKWFPLGHSYDWVTNPESGFRYSKNLHWTEIDDFNFNQGDIKYVWEKSRFCYLYTILRYDYHFKKDNSTFVFQEILSWIKSNPLNCGPNFVCSQEISIRMLNWIFCLYFYRYSDHVNEGIFQEILNSIYWQTKHVEKNINFSRIAVRNNHTITEALCLFTMGLLFPWFPEASKWKITGKNILEKEGLFQIYNDGSYIQHSFNYHRAIIQLYTWALNLGRVSGISFSNQLLERLKTSVNFLFQHQDEISGFLSNYGHNDGSIFFPLNNCDYRDYRPQINALYCILNKKSLYKNGAWQEDAFWFSPQSYPLGCCPIKQITSSFSEGGYFVLRLPDRFSFIRCNKYSSRPAHADNLHLDIWYKGHNILRDCGSFKYNVEKNEALFFMGTKAHNTVTIDNQDQMQKGKRFIWYYWSEFLNAKIKDNEDYCRFTGSINAFKHIRSGIIHKRTIRQFKKDPIWEIIDIVENYKGEFLQIWNIANNFDELGFKIISTGKKGDLLPENLTSGYYSPTYGIKENSRQINFISMDGYFHTYIYHKTIDISCFDKYGHS